MRMMMMISMTTKTNQSNEMSVHAGLAAVVVSTVLYDNMIIAEAASVRLRKKEKEDRVFKSRDTTSTVIHYSGSLNCKTQLKNLLYITTHHSIFMYLDVYVLPPSRD